MGSALARWRRDLPTGVARWDGSKQPLTNDCVPMPFPTAASAKLPEMTASTYEASISGDIVERCFWIYIWEATTPDGVILLYVGGDG